MKKKVAVITGTTSGLGYYIATYYRNNGYYVVGINRHAINNPNTAPVDQYVFFDLSDINDIPAFVHSLEEDYGRIDVFVNNAGVLYLDDLHEDLDTIRVDFEAPIYLCKEILNQDMVANKGHIINIASVSGMIGDVDAPVYSACKAGMINFTRSLAKMVAPHIRVNCISPGFFNTNLVGGKAPQELIDQVPMLREAEPQEIIPVVDMLQKSPYMTGANIVIDGGLSL